MTLDEIIAMVDGVDLDKLTPEEMETLAELAKTAYAAAMLRAFGQGDTLLGAAYAAASSTIANAQKGIKK